MSDRLTADQIVRAFNGVVATPPRLADLTMLQAAGLDTVEGLASYLWDHWLGEPDSPTQDEITARVRYFAMKDD